MVPPQVNIHLLLVVSAFQRATSPVTERRHPFGLEKRTVRVVYSRSISAIPNKSTR